MPSRRILLTTFGSLGDLHPYLAIGQALAARGHQVTVGTQAIFRARVEASGLEFWPVRMAVTEEPSAKIIRRVFAGGAGIRYLLRELVLPHLRLAHADTLAAARAVDVLVAHPLTFATPVVAEQLGLPWLSTQLAPNGLHSLLDPPALPGLEWVTALRRGWPWLHRAIFRAVWRLGDWQTGRWLRDVAELRRERGLGPGGNPLLAGAHSPFGVLALFSGTLAPRQADWPARVTVTGFPFYDQGLAVPAPLAAWLAKGPPPVVFTLGSSAVLDPGGFFEVSVRAAKQLGRRALLLGHVEGGLLPLVREGATPTGTGGVLDPEAQVYAAPYAPYAGVFPHAAAVVHQGGIGTTAEAMRAGRPMLVVPFGVDQPDNAAQVQRLGVAEVLRRSRYRPERVSEALTRLLAPDGAPQRALTLGAAVRAEDGALRAAEAIEAATGES